MTEKTVYFLLTMTDGSIYLSSILFKSPPPVDIPSTSPAVHLSISSAPVSLLQSAVKFFGAFLRVALGAMWAALWVHRLLSAHPVAHLSFPKLGWHQTDLRPAFQAWTAFLGTTWGSRVSLSHSDMPRAGLHFIQLLPNHYFFTLI